MIMEIDAKDSNSPIYQMAALAGDKAFNYYNLGPVDGNGLYSNSGHVLTERSHINLVRQRNQILNLANQDIAKMKQGSGLYVYNYAGNSTCSQSGLDGISFVPDDQKRKQWLFVMAMKRCFCFLQLVVLSHFQRSIMATRRRKVIVMLIITGWLKQT